MEDLNAVITAISGGGGVLGGSGIAYMMLKAWIARVMQDNRDLAREVRELRETHIGNILDRIDKIERFNAGCPASEFRESLSNLVGWMKKNDLKLDDVRDKMNQLLARDEAKGVWIGNLDRAQQSHIADHSIHGVHRNG